jgi:hypothetical protein
MGPLTALLIATPIFGFALSPPQIPALPYTALPLAQLESSGGFDDSAETEAVGDEQPPGWANTESVDSAGSASPEPKMDQSVYVKQLRKRARMAKVHRALGITTWASMAVAVAAGIVQYRNLYGGGKLESTPCTKGDAWPNNNECHGAPLGHAIPGFVTGGLYFTTLGLEMFMPDPDHASQGDSKFSKTLRTHKILRWIHLAGMVAQIGLGVVMANPKLGLERSSDFGTLKTLSQAHLGIGIGTFVALTWAGTIMLI